MIIGLLNLISKINLYILKFENINHKKSQKWNLKKSQKHYFSSNNI